MKWTLMMLMAVGCRGLHTPTTQGPDDGPDDGSGDSVDLTLVEQSTIYNHIGQFEVDNGAPATSIFNEQLEAGVLEVPSANHDDTTPIWTNKASDIDVIDDEPAMIYGSPTQVTCGGKFFIAVSGAMPTADTRKWIEFIPTLYPDDIPVQHQGDFPSKPDVFQVGRQYYTLDYSIVPMKFETILFAHDPNEYFTRVASASVSIGGCPELSCLVELEKGYDDPFKLGDVSFNKVEIDLQCSSNTLTLTRRISPFNGKTVTARVDFNATTIGASGAAAADNGGGASADEVHAIVEDAAGDLEMLMIATLVIVGVILGVVLGKGVMMVVNPSASSKGFFSIA